MADLGPNITAADSEDWDTFRDEMQACIDAADGKLTIVAMTWAVKMPLEKLAKICQIYTELGIDRIKTSAGVHFGDMEVEHVEFINRNFGDKIEIEVAGRVRSREKAEAMVAAGATSFHMGSWRRIGGIGQDIQCVNKRAVYSEYRDRL